MFCDYLEREIKMYLFILIIHLILLAVSMVFIGIVLSEKANDTTKYLLMATVCNFLVMLGYTQELLGVEKDISLASIKIELLGLAFLLSFLIFFMSRICNFFIPFPVRLLVMLLDIFFAVATLTVEFHSFFFSSVKYVEEGFYPHVVVEEGILCHASQVYNVGLGIMFTVICIHDFFRRRNNRDSQVYLLPLCFIPVISAVLLFYFLSVESMGFNPVPASITIGMSYFIFMVYRFRILDTTQIAKDNLVDSINEVYIVVDISKNLLFASQMAYQTIPELWDAKKRSDIIARIYRNNRKNMEIKDRQYQVSVSPFYDKRTLKGYSLWLFDKTEEIKNTQRLIELKNKAEEANYAKTLFLANMSHEIRTPINAIMGTTEVILRSDVKPEVRNMATDIKSAGEDLSSIISGILDFSKIESGEVESVEVNYDTAHAIRDVIKQFSSRARDKGLDFQANVAQDLPRGLRGDVTHVRQILNNLLDNACKYTQSGTITFTVNWEEENDMAKMYFSVQDTGCGIMEKAIPKLFDSFQRTDLRRNKDIQGTGLGLAIAKKLVESMNGEISVDSVYGRGSIFSFFIYQKIWDPAPVGDIFASQEEFSKEDIKEDFIAPDARILCVDDNLTNRKVIKELLSIYQIGADIVDSGKACLKRLEEKSDYHLIFMDQMMPEMDGIETVRRIQNMSGEARKIPVIALTANAVVGDREIFLDNGFSDYIPKPIELKVLENVLLQFLPPDIIRFIDSRNNPKEFGKAIVLPGVNVKLGMNRYGGERTRYLSALRFICDDGEKQVVRMREMLKNKKYEEYGFEVHAIKGFTLGIGAEHVSVLAREQETAAKENNIKVIAEKSEDFIKEYEMLLANIRFVLKENGMDSKEEIQISEEPLTEEEFIEKINEISQMLDMLDAKSASDEINSILRTEMEDFRRKELNQLLDKVMEFEYEDAKKTVESLLNIYS